MKLVFSLFLVVSLANGQTLMHWYDYLGQDFRIGLLSPYSYMGTEGGSIGYEARDLNRALGRPSVPVHLTSILATTVKFAYVAPDQEICIIDIVDVSRTSDSGGTLARTMTISGLTTGTSYSWRSYCGTEQLTGTFTTN